MMATDRNGGCLFDVTLCMRVICAGGRLTRIYFRRLYLVQVAGFWKAHKEQGHAQDVKQMEL